MAARARPARERYFHRMPPGVALCRTRTVAAVMRRAARPRFIPSHAHGGMSSSLDQVTFGQARRALGRNAPWGSVRQGYPRNAAAGWERCAFARPSREFAMWVQPWTTRQQYVDGRTNAEDRAVVAGLFPTIGPGSIPDPSVVAHRRQASIHRRAARGRARLSTRSTPL